MQSPLSATWPVKIRALALCLLPAAVAAAAYCAVAGFGYCDLDDAVYVTSNPLVLSGLSWENVLRAFSVKGIVAYWNPLLNLSFMADASLFGQGAGGYHLVNVLWHCANVALFCLLVLRLSGSRFAALFAALLLAVHPAHVEAVAWISARKDMLSTFFGLSAILIYRSWVHRPCAGKNFGLHLCHGLSLMAKPMFVTMPGLLLLLDWWPLSRLRGGEDGAAGGLWPDWRRVVACVREKVLLLALGLFATFMALSTHFRAYDRLDPDLGLKLANALAAYAKYLGLLVWPARQAIIYPFPASVPLAHSLGGAALLLGLTCLCLWQARKRPYLLVGWLWFLCALLPVIMPPKVGMHVALADRWTYVPFLGLYLAAGCLGAELLDRLQRPAPRRAAAAALLALLVPLTVAQQRQLATWATPASIYEQAMRVTTDSHVVQNNYAGLKLQAGDPAAAERHYQEALRIHPNYPQALYNLGLMRLEQGRLPESLELLRHAVEEMEKTDRAYEGYRALGYCLQSMGMLREAQETFRKAIYEQPQEAEAYVDWGNLAKGVGDSKLARELYARAVQVAPESRTARTALESLEGKGPEAP